MSLPDSLISATYLFQYKFKALNTLLNCATGGLNVTITSQVVVNAPTERAEKLILFLLYPYLLCGGSYTYSVLYSVQGE
jgi:hypothetical protein